MAPHDERHRDVRRDIDSLAGWIGSYGGAESSSDIQRGVWAADVGTPRLVGMFERYGITAGWFIPGHTIESFPEQGQMVADTGHKIECHGYSHRRKTSWRNPLSCGTAPRSHPTRLRCAVVGTAQRHTESAAPVRPHIQPQPELQGLCPVLREVRDSWTTIDYAKRAEEWMRPLKPGKEIDLVEIGANWYIDNLPPMTFMKASPNSHGFVNPRDTEQLWRDQFDWVHRNSTPRSSRSQSIPTSTAVRRYCLCTNGSSSTSTETTGSADR